MPRQDPLRELLLAFSRFGSGCSAASRAAASAALSLGERRLRALLLILVSAARRLISADWRPTPPFVSLVLDLGLLLAPAIC